MAFLHGRPNHFRVLSDLAVEVGAAALGHAGDVEVGQTPQTFGVRGQLGADGPLRVHLQKQRARVW